MLAERLQPGASAALDFLADHRGHHHDYVIGGVLSGSVCHSQPDTKQCQILAPSRPQPLIVPSGVEAKIEPPSPGYHRGLWTAPTVPMGDKDAQVSTAEPRIVCR
jgi:hypothetical protein